MSRQKATHNYPLQDNLTLLSEIIDVVDTVMLTLDEHVTDKGIYLNASCRCCREGCTTPM